MILKKITNIIFKSFFGCLPSLLWRLHFTYFVKYFFLQKKYFFTLSHAKKLAQRTAQNSPFALYTVAIIRRLKTNPKIVYLPSHLQIKMKWFDICDQIIFLRDLSIFFSDSAHDLVDQRGFMFSYPNEATAPMHSHS